MTILSATVEQDDRFKRCLEARQTGRIQFEYKPPFPTLDQLEKNLQKVELAVQTTDDVGIHEMADYFRDYVSLLKHFEMNPEGLELALQEFAISKV